MAANYLVKSAGIGASKVDEHDSRKAALLTFGLNGEVCEQLLQEEFIDSLMENETYKLCASI
jgi:hypothetical protein